jgi:prepilin-type N-terminal cleavage/methylation domain-containing protein
MIQRLQAKRNSEKGFTLIELLIVIIVLGILAAIVVFAVSGTKKDALEATCTTDQKAIELSAESVLAKGGPAGTYTKIDDVKAADLHAAASGGLLKEPVPFNKGGYVITWVDGTGGVKVSHPTDTAIVSCATVGA